MTIKHQGSMKRALGAFGLGIAILASSGIAFAQDEGEGADTGEEEPQPEVGATGETGAGGEPQVLETHLVEKGDTLWDLCAKFLNSPWYWPKIWSYNPQITNPHWIFPGNEIRFYPSDENLPTAVAVSRDLEGGAPGETEEGEGDGQLIPGQLDVEDMVKSVAPVSVNRVAQDSVFTRYRGFLTTDQQNVAGQIANSPSETQLLSDYDRVYVKLKSAAKKGESYAVYRTIKGIEHPYTGEPYGYAIEIVGALTVIDTSPQVATGLITSAFRPIERGDYVGPWPESAERRIQPVANEADVKAYIVDTLEGALSELGEHHVVFIDKGRTDGVKLGNTFTVFGRGDGFTRELGGLPNEELGRLMIIDVQERVSTAMVVRSVKEISVGDKVEMRKAI